MCINLNYVKYLYTLNREQLNGERERVCKEIDAGSRHRAMYHAIMFIDTATARLDSNDGSFEKTYENLTGDENAYNATVPGALASRGIEVKENK